MEQYVYSYVDSCTVLNAITLKQKIMAKVTAE